MVVEKNRLTLDLDPHLERRLKTTAALKGVSMVRYCHHAIDRELSKDEAQGVVPLPFGHGALDRLAALREATFDGKLLPDDLLRSFERAARGGHRHDWRSRW